MFVVFEVSPDAARVASASAQLRYHEPTRLRTADDSSRCRDAYGENGNERGRSSALLRTISDQVSQTARPDSVPEIVMSRPLGGCIFADRIADPGVNV